MAFSPESKELNMGNSPEPIRVVIAAENEGVRDSIRQLLLQQLGLSILGEASDVTSAAKLTNRLKPDVVLLGSCLVWHNGTVVRGNFNLPVVPAIVVLASVDRPQVLRAFRYGARGIISNSSTPGVLLDCIRAVMNGQYWFDSDTVTIIVNALRETRPYKNNGGEVIGEYRLTPRELDIVAKLAGGCSNKEIGDKLFISERTVKHHLTNIFVKVGVSSRLELAMLAVNHDFMKDGTSIVRKVSEDL
jgi:two-component system nitrate/nitrite response regulator NarL